MESLLRAGLKPKEVLQRLPDIPRATVYDWAKQMGAHQEASGKPEPDSPAATASEPAVVPDEVTDSKGRIIPFRQQSGQPPPPVTDSDNLASVNRQLTDYSRFVDQLLAADENTLPDFLLVKREMRKLVATSNNPIVKVQASHLLTKLIQMSSEIPRHILFEESQSDLNRSLSDLDQLSDDELARQYKQMLD